MAKKNLKDPLESYKQARKVAADAGYKPAQKEQQEEAASNAPWYRGNAPTASEMTARANTLYAGDEVKRDEVLGKIEKRMDTPGSGVYNPYRTATNTGLIDSLSALGIDTSGGINADFFSRNSGYQQYLKLSATSGTPSAPTKKSTPQEQAAYYLYQLQKDEDTTQKAETEWAAMQKEISYWAGKGYSDDEILAKVNADGKYSTLKKMDSSAAAGAPTALNRAVGYSKDAQYGAIWSARNGGGSGDAFADAVSYASGVGKGYSADKTLEARRDVTSKDYMPYADGSTLDDANMYFGVSSFDQDWINANKGLLNGTDSTAAKYFKQVYQAEQTTQEAEQERTGVYAWIDAMQRQGMSADKIGDLLQSMYNDPSSTDAVHMSALKKMDEGRRSGDPVALTRSVDWRLEDALAYVRGGRTAETGAAGRQNAAKLGQTLSSQRPSDRPGSEKAKSDDVAEAKMALDAALAESDGTNVSLEFTERPHLKDPQTGETMTYFSSSYSDGKGTAILLTPIKADGTMLSDDEAWNYAEQVLDSPDPLHNDPDGLVMGVFHGATDDIAIEKAEKASDAYHNYHTAEELAQNAQTTSPSTETNKNIIADLVAQKAEDETPTTAETGEAAEDVREQSEAETQRAQLVEEYQTLQHSAEVRGYAQTESMDALREEISTLTAQIGDNFTLDRPYTTDEAEAVLTKVYAGTEELTEDEQKIFSSFFDDYGGLFGIAGGSDGGYRDYDSALLYGSKAMEALTWTDSPEATTRDGVQTIMQIVKDSQSAELAGLSLDDWYAENPDAEARLMQVKDNVLASREAKAEAQKQQAAEQRQQQLAYNVHVLQQVASGEALDETDQAAYDRIMQTDAKQLLATDAGYAARIDALYEDTAPRAFAEKMGLSDDQQEYAPFVADIVEDYYATDAKLAASVGLTLDELYAQYPALQKSEDAVIEQARQDYSARWNEPADSTPEGEGLGFFKSLALGADSGWNSWVSGKIGFYQAITTHDDETVAQDNYDVYVRTYGIAGARRAYSNDVASAIYAMADDDPMKAVYAQQFADAQRNGTDIFQLPFNFTAETLRQARQKFDANVQANADLVNEYGTWAEKCLLYPVSSSVVSNSLNLAESAAVTGLTGVPTLGTVAGYGLQQFGETKLEAMGNGLSSAEATLVGVLDAASTAFLESKMAEKYIPSVFGGAVKDATVSAARKGGTAFFSKVGALAKEFFFTGVSTGVDEAIQENAENILSGGIKAAAYGDAAELTSQLQLGQVLETAAMAFTTSFALTAEGKGMNLIVQQAQKRAKTEQQQTQQESQQQQESTETEQYAQTEQTSQEAQTELTPTQENNVVLEADSGEAVQPMGTVSEAQQQAVREAIAQVMGYPEAMEQVVEARAAQIVNERVGLGELNTEQISQLTARAQETESALLTARNTQAEQRQELQRVQAILQKANQRASTQQGAKTISQYAPKAANLREALRVSNQQVQEAQQAYQTARQELKQARQAAYTQLQQQAMTQAQQEIQQAAELTAEAAMTGDNVQEIQSQQQQADTVAQTSAPDAAQELKAARSAYYQARKQGKALQTQKQQLTAQLQGHLQAVRVAEQNGSDVSAFAQSLEQITGALTEVDKQIQQQAQVIKNARAEMNRLAAGGQENPQQTQGAQNAQNAPQTVQEAPQMAQAEQAQGQTEGAAQGQNEAPVTAAEQTQGYPYKNDTAQGAVAEAGSGGNGLPPASGTTQTETADNPEGPQHQFGRKTAQASEAIDQATKDWLYTHSGYTADSNRAQIDRAVSWVESQGASAAAMEWLAQDESTMGTPDSHVRGIVLMGLAAKTGNTQLEVLIADKYNRLGKTPAQTLQARKIFNMLSPLGAQAYVRKQISRANTQYSRNGAPLDIQISDQAMQAIGDAQTLEERQSAVDAALKEAAAQIPPTVMDKLNAFRYLAMLGNPRTHIRNIVGNGVFMPEVGVRNKISAGLQSVAYNAGWIDSKTRSTALVTDEAYREFARNDANDARVENALKEGEKYLTDQKQGGAVIEQNRRSFDDSALGNAMQKASDFVGNALSAEDLVAKKYYYKRALASYLQANNIDLQTVDTQTMEKARLFAVQEAMKNTYNNRNAFVAWFAKAENDLRNMGSVGRVGAMAIEGVVPFKNTPANVITRGVEYSPAGLAKSLIVDLIRVKNGTISPHQFIDNVSSGLTGTMAFALGMGLRALGCISGSLGDDDADKFARLNGEQEYAFRMFGHSYTADWLAPGGISLFTGADFFDMMADSGVLNLTDMLESVGRLTEPVYNLTMLDGVNSIFDASDTSEGFAIAAQNYLGQFVPTLFGQIARTIDPVRRTNYTDKNSWIPVDVQYFLNKQRNKIPGLSTLSTPYVDAFGRQDVSNNVWLRAFENFISPGYLNDLQENDVTAMIDQVAKESGEDVYPSSTAKYISVGGERKNLTAEQWTQYQTQAGEDLYAALDVLSKDADFAGLEPAYQAKAIKNATQYAIKKAQQALYPDVSAAKWITKAETVPEAAREAVSRAHDSMVSDYAEANAKEIIQWAQDGNLEACETLMPIFRELGLKDSEIKSKLAAEAKEVYQKAWMEGDTATCLTLESVLDAMNVGFSSKDYKAWKTDTQKEK